MLKLKLRWQILFALIAGIAVGLLARPEATLFGVQFLTIYNFIGTLFLNGLRMVIVPLIMASIITGVAGVGGEKGLGSRQSRPGAGSGSKPQGYQRHRVGTATAHQPARGSLYLHPLELGISAPGEFPGKHCACAGSLKLCLKTKSARSTPYSL